MITLTELCAATGAKKQNAEVYLSALCSAMAANGINTRARVAAFLGQLTVESAALSTVTESLYYSYDRLLKVFPRYFTADSAAKCAYRPEAIADIVYARRLGNTCPGDGFKYRGRGLIQVTGKANYAALAKALNLDLIGNPGLLELPTHAADSAALFFASNGCLALADALDYTAISKKVNGGVNALQERLAASKRAYTALSRLR